MEISEEHDPLTLQLVGGRGIIIINYIRVSSSLPTVISFGHTNMQSISEGELSITNLTKNAKSIVIDTTNLTAGRMINSVLLDV